MAPTTKSEKYVLSRKDKWEKLRLLLSRIYSLRNYRLSEKEVKELPGMYRSACVDLTEARMLELSPDVIYYLNEIVGQTHKYLYRLPPVKRSSLKRFFTVHLPRTVLKNWIFVLLSAVIFLGSYLITYLIIINYPEFAGDIVSDKILKMMEQSYSTSIVKGRDVSAGSMAVSFYIQNNVSIAFASFASGILLGIGTIYILLYNGITLGTISAYVVSIGYGDNFVTFITAHSVLELFGIVLSGAAGLLLGYTIINGQKYYRKDWLKLQKNNIFTLVAASALLILIAAFIEGFISPSTLDYSFKASIAVISAIAVILYFIVLPVIRKKYSNE